MKYKEYSGEEEMDTGELNLEELAVACERKEFSSIPDLQITLLKEALAKVHNKPKKKEKKNKRITYPT